MTNHRFLESVPKPADNPATASQEATKQAEQPPTPRLGLVVLAINLESALPRLSQVVQSNQLGGSTWHHATKMWSPYREPLLRFLAKYSAQSVAYFLDPVR